MTGFELLLGHLTGDYLFQNDWQAKNKTNPHPGLKPVGLFGDREVSSTDRPDEQPGDCEKFALQEYAYRAWKKSIMNGG